MKTHGRDSRTENDVDTTNENRQPVKQLISLYERMKEFCKICTILKLVEKEYVFNLCKKTNITKHISDYLKHEKHTFASFLFSTSVTTVSVRPRLYVRNLYMLKLNFNKVVAYY